MKEKIKNYWNRFKEWNKRMINEKPYWHALLVAILICGLLKIIF